MKYWIEKKIGQSVAKFEVEGVDLFECILEAKKLSFGNVAKCGVCGSEYLYLDAYKTKEKNYKYTKIVCSSCRASVTFGQKTEDPSTYYLRKNENKGLDWKEYTPST